MKLKGVIMVLLGAASFGFTPIFVKSAFHSGYSLGQINITQMLIALVLLGIMYLAKGLHIRELTKSNLVKIIATGTTVGLTSIFYYGAMQYLSASLAIILLFQFVWIGMIYEWIFHKIRPSGINIVSMVVTLTGVLFASNIMEEKIVDLPALGLLLGLLAGVTYAGFIFFSGQVAVTTHPIVRSFWMVSGSLVLVLIVFSRDVQTLFPFELSLWLFGASLALVGAVIPPLFFAIGAPLISGRLANVLSSVELPVAIVSAMLILSESVTFLQWFGIMLIVAAIIINELGATVIRRSKEY
ncbi:EamA family transporter [Thalassobacillus pellis]|uniref:EamA family transporter n=1 Tax=Thalassobacillus pellis TaxID=748008 RepID=UPI00195FDD1E|nr:DMT family transporter [Thalassobacillus pellis]MBM7552992.1 drug/metabolite transporter (DMT)-like permease [Thalassobacillus pellis]